MENSGELTQEVKVCWAHAWAGAGAGVGAATLRPSQSQSIDMVNSTRFLSSEVSKSVVVEEIIVWSQQHYMSGSRGVVLSEAEWCAVQSVVTSQCSVTSSAPTHQHWHTGEAAAFQHQRCETWTLHQHLWQRWTQQKIRDVTGNNSIVEQLSYQRIPTNLTLCSHWLSP